MHLTTAPQLTGTHTHLADKEIRLVEVSSKQSGRFTGYGLNLDAHFLTLACTLHSFVVDLQASHDSEITELQAQHKMH